MKRRIPGFLWWRRPNTFQADDASAVVLIDRFRLRYREGDRSMIVEQDLQGDPKLVAIERASMRSWEPPQHGDRVTEADRNRIIANMRGALAARGYKLILLDVTPLPTLPAGSRPVTSEVAGELAIEIVRFLEAPDATITALTSRCEAATGEQDNANAGQAVWSVQIRATVTEPRPPWTRDSQFTIEINQATGEASVIELVNAAPPPTFAGTE
jgi:hypothetical protein